MGCCSSKEEKDEVVIELNTATNAAVQCRKGKCAEGLEVTSLENGNLLVKGLKTGGIMLGSCALDCDVAYWEVKVHKIPSTNEGGVHIGLKKFQVKTPVPLTGSLQSDNDGKGEAPSWNLSRSALGKDRTDLKEGDVVGVHWDQTDFPMVSFTLNGAFLPKASITRIRPAQDIFPAVSVAAGCALEVCFDAANFAHKPISSKFGGIICASSLI
jgi:hypothetical protein